jgi:aminoglycoside phosphotransferase (APT) family kinase protein
LRAAAPHGSGHIHETFVVSTQGPDGEARYLLQRLNGHVFRDLEGLMRNLARVTSHLRRGLEARGVDPTRRCLHLVETRTGSTHHVDASGAVWRCFDFVERSHTLDVVTSPAPAETAARAFGAFAAACADLDPDALVETIPGFHDLAGRVDALNRAVRADRLGRAGALRLEIRAADDVRRRVVAALTRAGESRLPIRVVHNDCKINNVLFDDDTGDALCVIDLDTVMPGRVLFDFGDLVRTAACPAPEDTRDLDAVRFDLDVFRALARGYQTGAQALLTAAERDLLALAGPAAALENAVRFLTDHIEGDVYFRVRRGGHNLDRFRAQLVLTERMLEALDPARQIVAETDA